jgi:hypothetical protein
MKDILFTDTMGVIPDYFPAPAKNFVPKWYKDTRSYIGDKKGIIDNAPSTTIKKCVPVFDIMTAGYIIPTWSDIWVTIKEDNHTFYSTDRNMKFDYHPISQVKNYPTSLSKEGAHKFINPWSIRTPKGYSCFFLPPAHNPNPYFEVLSGLVDTDEYYAPVNFPFTFKQKDFEGLIPAGTPLVQVIPIKREKWQMKFGKSEDETKAAKILHELRVNIFNSYRNRFWDRKEFN